MSKHRIRNLRLREISSVDRPAQVGAVSVLIKRGEDPRAELIKATFEEALKGNMLSEKVQDVFYKAFETWWSGKEAFRKALIDELAAGGDGATASEAFKKWLGALVDQARGVAITAGAAEAADLEKVFNDTAEDWLSKKEQTMTIKTKAELQAAIEKAQAAGDKVTVADVQAIHKAATDLKEEGLLPATGPLAKAAPAVDPALAAKVERMEKRDALSVDLRKHYDGLADDAARDTFLALDAAAQQAEVTKSSGDDPVVYTTLDGIQLRKSAGETTIALAKSNDDLRRRLAKSEATSEDVTLEKRAKDDLGNIGGELIGKKALLKAVDGIADEPTREAAKAVLKAANEGAKGIMKREGSSGTGGVSPTPDDASYAPSDAERQLDDMAKVRAKEGNITFEKAYSEVIQTAEGQALYKRFIEGE